MRTEKVWVPSKCFALIRLPVEQSGEIGYLINDWPNEVKSVVATDNDRLTKCKDQWGQPADYYDNGGDE